MQKPPICTAETPMPKNIPWEEKQQWFHPDCDPVDREARMAQSSLYEWIPCVECRYCGKGYSIVHEDTETN